MIITNEGNEVERVINCSDDEQLDYLEKLIEDRKKRLVVEKFWDIDELLKKYNLKVFLQDWSISHFASGISTDGKIVVELTKEELEPEEPTLELYYPEKKDFYDKCDKIVKQITDGLFELEQLGFQFKESSDKKYCKHITYFISYDDKTIDLTFNNKKEIKEEK